MPKGLNVQTTKNETVHRLYQTDIVKIDHEKRLIQLETGGWFTMHTKKCMNLALRQLGLYVSQKKGDWYVSKEDGSVVSFQDGMILNF